MKLDGKYALITGASTGIGQAIAIKFAEEGAIVGLVARSKEGLNETLSEVKKFSKEADLFAVDLRNISSIKSMIRTIRKTRSKVDILVNVAGVWHNNEKVYAGIDFEDFSTDEIVETYDVGITAPTILAHETVGLMNEKSKIVNISGTFESGAKGWLPYYVSKKAIENLTIGLSQELKEKGIQVNCISPSDTITEKYKKFFPEYAKPSIALEPKEVANLALKMVLKQYDSITGKIVIIKKEDSKVIIK